MLGFNSRFEWFKWFKRAMLGFNSRYKWFKRAMLGFNSRFKWFKRLERLAEH